jgi:hypothetical protein
MDEGNKHLGIGSGERRMAMRSGVWIALLAVVFCGAALAGEVAKVTPKDGAGTAVKAKNLVDYEGAKVAPAEAARLKAQGAHRWADECLTHNAHDLKKEIDILNMLNSLYLSDVQMRHVMVVATKAEKARRAALKEADGVTARLEKSLAGVRKEMLATGKDKCETSAMGQVRECQGKLDEINKTLGKDLVAYESYVKAILTDNQREKVYNYEHCLIPVKSLRDPARIGSPDSGSINEKLLEQVRAMSPEAFEAQKEPLIDAHFHKMIKYMGDLSDDARAKERDKMLTLFAKARMLNDLDFQFSKARMAAQLNCDYSDVKDRLKETKKQLLKVQNEKRFDGKSGPGIFSTMFLDARIIPLLAERLRIYEGFKGEEAVDLDKIEKAAGCANGSCAID